MNLFFYFISTSFYNARKKKFINCSNDKKWTLRLLILLVVFSVIGTIISLIFKFNAIF